MTPDRPRSNTAVIEVLLWQNRYRLVLAGLIGLAALALRLSGVLAAPALAVTILGKTNGTLLIAFATAAYCVLVLFVQKMMRQPPQAAEVVSTLMVAADIVFVFSLAFLMAEPHDYYRGLLVALFSVQLTHVYFGRTPALLMLVTTAALYILLTDVAVTHAAEVEWKDALVTLAVFSAGALLVTGVQANLHSRLAHLVSMFERAEEGDFSDRYDVAADKRPDAITAAGRAYNRMRGQLATIVLTDPLSGCLNRRGFEQQYKRELARAARSHTDVALLAVDIDHFKQVNDVHGHLVGDRVIAETGALLRATARAQDVVARTGGEEFTILAPDTSLEGALNLANRIVIAFRERVFAGSDVQVRVTVSVGVVADQIQDVSVAEDLRARADEALYGAKRAGRNRVVPWSQDLGTQHITSEFALPLRKQ